MYFESCWRTANDIFSGNLIVLEHFVQERIMDNVIAEFDSLDELPTLKYKFPHLVL